MKLNPITATLVSAYIMAVLAAGMTFEDADIPSGRVFPATTQEPITDEAPEELAPDSLCANCHSEITNRKRVHRPVRVGECKLCHLQNDTAKHTFEAPADMGKVCSECHALPPRNLIHAPVESGDCLACHSPHQSEERYLLRAPTEKELCGKCHQSQIGVDLQHVHGPAAAGACSLCHFSHSSYEPKLLRTSGSQACLNCHVEMNQVFESPNVVHTPVRQDCAGCHDAHASENQFQLKATGKALCMNCHIPMMKQVESSSVVHAALLTQEGCVHCHDPHSSPYPNMLKAPIGQLCMSCHVSDIDREDGSSLPGIGEKIRNSAHLHGPLAEGNCSACHNPHGSATFSLLRESYPREFYSGYQSEKYKLCFGCHDSSSIETEFTETHTGFRDGDRNLHHLHVTNEKKGRTCRACHDHHASNLPKQMTSSVPFGTWELPIGFTPTPTGGSCAPGCHTPKTYDRLEARNILPIGPDKDLIQEAGSK